MSLLHRAHMDGELFCNPVPTEIGGLRMALRVLPLYLTNRAERFPREPLHFQTDSAAYRTPPATGLRVTWFGHSGALLEIDGLRLLLDPVWDPRASPFTRIGPKRFFAPTLALRDLPELDAILITHDHYDHLGAQTIRDLAGADCARDAQWITSLRVGPILAGFGAPRDRIAEMDWTDALVIRSCRSEATAKLTAYPARHFSGRSVRGRFKTLWSSFVFAGHNTPSSSEQTPVGGPGLRRSQPSTRPSLSPCWRSVPSTSSGPTFTSGRITPPARLPIWDLPVCSCRSTGASLIWHSTRGASLSSGSTRSPASVASTVVAATWSTNGRPPRPGAPLGLVAALRPRDIVL